MDVHLTYSVVSNIIFTHVRHYLVYNFTARERLLLDFHNLLLLNHAIIRWAKKHVVHKSPTVKNETLVYNWLFFA